MASTRAPHHKPDIGLVHDRLLPNGCGLTTDVALGIGAEMKRPALAGHLTAHGLVPEMLAGPLPGMYGPCGSGRLRIRVMPLPVTSP